MENVTDTEKSTLKQKLLEFQKKGLESYGKYLVEQLEYAAKSDSRKAYKQYVEDQIELNIKRISEIEEKLA